MIYIYIVYHTTDIMAIQETPQPPVFAGSVAAGFSEHGLIVLVRSLA